MISGGGTGRPYLSGHCHCQCLEGAHADSEILFVGAEGKMEMQKVPEAGYKIVGLKVAGLQRSLSLSNLSFPFKLLASLNKSQKTASKIYTQCGSRGRGICQWPIAICSPGQRNSYLDSRAKFLCRSNQQTAIPKKPKVFVSPIREWKNFSQGPSSPDRQSGQERHP
jgi:hypothetical protein